MAHPSPASVTEIPRIISKPLNFGLVTYDTLGINQTYYGEGEYKMDVLGFIYPNVKP